MVFKKKTKKKLAFFLDRDGVINHEVGHLKSWEKIKFYNGTVRALKIIKKKKYLIFIVTNQSIIARKNATKNEIESLHKKFLKYFKTKNIKINAIYFCPHHPKYSGSCNCRKPKIGLIKKAQNRYNIDIKNSWLVGDKTTDIKAGKKSGLKTILVKTGYGGLDKKYKVKADYTYKNLIDAVKNINL